LHIKMLFKILIFIVLSFDKWNKTVSHLKNISNVIAVGGFLCFMLFTLKNNDNKHIKKNENLKAIVGLNFLIFPKSFCIKFLNVSGSS